MGNLYLNLIKKIKIFTNQWDLANQEKLQPRKAPGAPSQKASRMPPA